MVANRITLGKQNRRTHATSCSPTASTRHPKFGSQLVRIVRRVALGLVVVGVLSATVVAVSQKPARKLITAQVPASLVKDQAYTRYAAIAVQLELLKDTVTAGLPIQVEVAAPGELVLRGSVPNARVRRHIHHTALRVSGITVQDGLRTSPVTRGYLVNVSPEKLDQYCQETMTTLFPKVARKVELKVSKGNIVTLTGQCDTYEEKLMLSRAIKSQPGCQAVENLIDIPADAKTGKLFISEDRRLLLASKQIPRVPAGPKMDPRVLESTSNSPFGGPIMADDAPESDLVAQQIREDIRARLDRESTLLKSELDIQVVDGQVTLLGHLDSRDQVEKAVALASKTPGVHRVVAKTRPYSLQRNIPARPKNDPKTDKDKEPPKPRKILGFIPFGRKKDVSDQPTNTRRFRRNLRKSILNQCDNRVKELTVEDSLDGLVIEGEVKNSRDRTFVFKQIDDIAELKNLRCDIILHVNDGK